MSLTYSELEKIIQSMTPKEKNQPVAIRVNRMDWFGDVAIDEVYIKEGEIYLSTI